MNLKKKNPKKKRKRKRAVLLNFLKSYGRKDLEALRKQRIVGWL